MKKRILTFITVLALVGQFTVVVRAEGDGTPTSVPAETPVQQEGEENQKGQTPIPSETPAPEATPGQEEQTPAPVETLAPEISPGQEMQTQEPTETPGSEDEEAAPVPTTDPLSEEKLEQPGMGEHIIEEVLKENPVVYSVTLPTTSHFEFILDPMGISNLKEGESLTLEELAERAGKIYCNENMMITSKSSVPVKVSVSMQVTGDANTVSSVSEVEQNDKTNILLCAVPAKYDVRDDINNYEPSDQAIIVGKNETKIDFILPASTYYYQSREDDGEMVYRIAEGETGHSLAVCIKGRVSRRADWSDYLTGEDKKVGLKVTYTFIEEASEETADSTIGYAMKQYDGATVLTSEIK